MQRVTQHSNPQKVVQLTETQLKWLIDEAKADGKIEERRKIINDELPSIVENAVQAGVRRAMESHQAEENENRLIDPKEAAKILNRSLSTIYKFVDNGKLIPDGNGKTHRFLLKDVLALKPKR